MFFLGSFFRVDLAADALGETRLRADVAVEQVRRLDLAEGGTLHVMMRRRRIRVYPGGPDSG